MCILLFTNQILAVSNEHSKIYNEIKYFLLFGVDSKPFSVGSLSFRISATSWTILSYLIPLMLVLAIFCYGKCRQNHNFSAARESHGENKKQNSSLIITITALYFILWLPFCALRIKYASSNDEHNTEIYWEKHTAFYK